MINDRNEERTLMARIGQTKHRKFYLPIEEITDKQQIFNQTHLIQIFNDEDDGGDDDGPHLRVNH